MDQKPVASRVLSGDGHIDLNYLPSTVFEGQGPSALRDRMPRVVDTSAGKRWMSGDRDIAPVGGVGFLGQLSEKNLSKHVDAMAATGFFEDVTRGVLHPTDADLRVKDQELDGVSGEVIYGILGAGDALGDHELTAAVYGAYNRWVAEFCGRRPDRLVGLACIPNHDPHVAHRESPL